MRFSNEDIAFIGVTSALVLVIVVLGGLLYQAGSDEQELEQLREDVRLFADELKERSR